MISGKICHHNGFNMADLQLSRLLRITVNDPNISETQFYVWKALKIETGFQGRHCVKSVQIRRFFWSVFSCIRTRRNSVFGHYSRSAYYKKAVLNYFAILQENTCTDVSFLLKTKLQNFTKSFRAIFLQGTSR